MISVAVLTHNRWNYTRQCLDRILDVMDVEFQLIVLDSLSTDETRDMLSCFDPHSDMLSGFTTILFSENVGCRGMNAAFDVARYDMVVKVDNDVLLPHGWASYTAKALQLFPGFLLGPNPMFLTDHAVDFPNPPCSKLSRDGIIVHRILSDQNISGFFMAMTKKTYQQAGPFRAPANSGYGACDSVYCQQAHRNGIHLGYMKPLFMEMLEAGPFTPDEIKNKPHVAAKYRERDKWGHATEFTADAPIESIVRKP